MAVKPIPDGYHTLTPYLTTKGAAQAIEFYKKAFGATELMRMPGPDGRLMHAELKIGDSTFMLSDEFPEMGGKSPQTLGGSPVFLFVYCDDVDQWVNRAVQAGATMKQPPTDMFWGDRYGMVEDPFGHKWSIATHKEDVSPAEMKKRQEAWVAAQSAS